MPFLLAISFQWILLPSPSANVRSLTRSCQQFGRFLNCVYVFLLRSSQALENLAALAAATMMLTLMLFPDQDPVRPAMGFVRRSQEAQDRNLAPPVLSSLKQATWYLQFHLRLYRPLISFAFSSVRRIVCSDRDGFSEFVGFMIGVPAPQYALR
jgi:hypothetical protein